MDLTPGQQMSLVDRIVAIHLSLQRARLPHAFGGALALAWCTQRARGTIDIDVNVFVSGDRMGEVLAGLPDGVKLDDAGRHHLERDGQARLWWDATPVDLFLNTTDFHVAASGRARTESFAGLNVPFLACRDLAVFKAFFNRTKDWADLEEMHAAGELDIEAVAGVLVRYLGTDDQRLARLLSLHS
ncbi:MAG TPA: hypothetical protein VMM60_08935 [Ilumatobacter sp.]|nr:hypothetical protein [Ilumatobacter sp.]